MPSRRVEFPGSFGTPLAGVLDQGASAPRAWAIFAHCFTCSKESLAAAHVAKALVAEGCGVLRFDFTGLGDSAGDFSATTFSSNVADVLAAARWLAAGHDAPALLVGHSMGGAAVLAAAGEIASVRVVATIAAPAEPVRLIRQFEPKVAEIERAGSAEVMLAGRPFSIRRELLADLAAQNHRERIRSLGRALLVLHSPDDDTVPITDAGEIFQTARHPKSFVSLAGANHLLSERADARYAARVIAAWASRYIGLTQEASAR